MRKPGRGGLLILAALLLAIWAWAGVRYWRGLRAEKPESGGAKVIYCKAQGEER